MASKEQVESLGGKFLTEKFRKFETGGYAKEASDAKQSRKLCLTLKKLI